MEDRETPRMRKYGESKTTQIMMATVPHVTSGSGLRKFKVDRIFVRQSVQWPNNAQLIDKLLYCSYVFRHYCVILRELVVSTFLSYTSITNDCIYVLM